MKRIGMFCIIGITLLATIGTVSAGNYTIDGCIKDLGVNLSEDWNMEETWVPLSPTADWVVENNIDCSLYYSGANYCGVHITGSGAFYTYYAEPEIKMRKIGWWVSSNKQPYHERGWSARSRELNDIEAMYFDTNETQAYVAIVTSIPLDTVMSDLAISSSDGYEYGIVLNGKDKGKIYQNPSWSETDKFKGSGPYRIIGGTFIGTADIAYEDQRIFDFGKTNWVIEIGIPKINITKLHVTLFCGNDVVEVTPVKPTPIPTLSPSPEPIITPAPTLSPTPTTIPSPMPTISPTPTPTDEEIPEFSTIAIPVAAVIGLLFFFNRRKQNKK